MLYTGLNSELKDAVCAVRGQGLSLMMLQEKSPMDVVASNTLTGAEAMVEMLKGHGVRHIFGLCGDTTLPFYCTLPS